MATLTNRWSSMADVFDQMNRLQQEMDRLFTASPGEGLQFPPVNVYVNDQASVVTAELPGVDPAKLDVTAIRNTLTIKGERNLDRPADVKAWHRRERQGGKFTRTVQLPFVVNPDAVKASYRDGVLEVWIERPAESKPRKITVTEA